MDSEPRTRQTAEVLYRRVQAEEPGEQKERQAESKPLQICASSQHR